MRPSDWVDLGVAALADATRPDVLARVGAWVVRAWTELGRGFAWLSTRTGFPALILAAAALVLGFRLARKVGRLAIEFALALVLLIALRKLGWMTW